MFYQNQQPQQHQTKQQHRTQDSSRSVHLRPPLFVLDDVSIEYGNHRALRSVDLTIERGEMIFLTGRSGAGKTTLLKLLAQELIPTSGHLQLAQTQKKLFTAVVFQDLRLIGNLSGLENLLFSYDGALYRSKNEFMQDVQELAKILDIKDRLHLLMKDANGGLRQKIAIMRALLSRPDVLIADEPTSALDTENARRLFDVFTLYNQKRQMTVIWATHNRELIKNFNGRILHLDAGKLVYSGSACFI